MQELAQLYCSPLAGNTPPLTGRETSQLKVKLSGWETHTKKGELRLENHSLSRISGRR